MPKNRRTARDSRVPRAQHPQATRDFGRAALGVAALSLAIGCGTQDGALGAPLAPSAGASAAGPAGMGAALPAAGAAAAFGGAGQGTVPSAMPAAGGMASAPPTASNSPMPVAGNAGVGGAGGHAHMGAAGGGAAKHPCLTLPPPDPRDAMLTGEPRTIQVGANEDLLVPELVEEWMDENEFAEAHDAWHLVRKWDQGCRRSNAPAEGCRSAQRLVAQGLARAPIQQGAPGDGLAFMMMHRHMIEVLKATFPENASLFDGFRKVPRTRDDPENPKPNRAPSWTSDNLAGFDILENIEDHLDRFPTEDDLGAYIQNTYVWTSEQPLRPVSVEGDGLHGALHAQWAVSGSPANLIQQAVDVKNHIFWKLHGWIDDVWERYRVAKGMTREDPEYQKLLIEQCEEMHALMPSKRGMAPGPGTGAAGAPSVGAETGVFARDVRPIFEESCAGCHDSMGPSAGLTLGGAGVSSAEVYAGIVGQMSTNGEYALIEPGDPARSWIYLKVSGDVATAACSGMCERQKMPPAGLGLGAAQLTTLRQWILDGAAER